MSILYKYCKYDELMNETFNPHQTNNIIISVASTYDHFISDEFIAVADSLFKQRLQIKYVVINLYNQYETLTIFDQQLVDDRNQYLLTKYNNIIIKHSEKHGTISKIFGLMDIDDVDENDRIITVDDDWIMDNNMTLYYELCYEIFSCEFIAIDKDGLVNRNDECIFYDNYQGFIFNWLSVSFKYKYVKLICDFYIQTTNLEPKLMHCDDLIMTLFYKKFRIYTCGINIIFNKINNKFLSKYDFVKKKYKMAEINNLEQQILCQNNIPFENVQDQNFIVNKNDNYENIDFIIENTINKRFNIHNINNLTINNDFINGPQHVCISYFNDNIAIITITSIDKNIDDNVKLNLNNAEIDLLNLTKN